MVGRNRARSLIKTLSRSRTQTHKGGFVFLDNAEELAAALDAQWEKWIVFLHPAQRDLVSRRFTGPARVSGSAGTGKTVVAIHRAAEAMKAGKGHVLLTTFSEDLAKSLFAKVKLLVAAERLANRLPKRDRPTTLVVASLDDIGVQLRTATAGDVKTISEDALLERITSIVNQTNGVTLSPQFLHDEWTDVVDGWNLNEWPQYRDFKRLGRKTRLGESGRRQAWDIFQRLRQTLVQEGTKTLSMVFTDLTKGFSSPFHSVVVDECQDISPAQLQFLAGLTRKQSGELFLAGDLGQPIFQTPFSWSILGVDIRGRSRTLKINYRTSHQIRRQADRLLDGSLADVDGNEEHRDGTISAFNGPLPLVFAAEDEEAESDYVANWLLARIGDNIAASEIAIFGRTQAQLARARDAVRKACDISGRGFSGIRLATMHSAKGLEFRCACVMACDDNIVPLEERIRAIGDQADLEDHYNTERHLLYVACTRARDHLLVTGVNPVSEFLEDLQA